MVARIAGLAKRPEVSHAFFLGVWAGLLFIVGFFGSRPNLPWVEWALGLAPALAGYAGFLAWQKEGPWRWLLLCAGEALGIFLGQALLPTLAQPLVLLALWPLAWAALKLPGATGWWFLGGAAATYLFCGLGQALRTAAFFHHYGLALVLHLAAFGSIFALLHTLTATRPDRTGQRFPALPERDPHLLPRVETPPPPPATEDLLHQDLAVARDIQVSLLLASSPRLPGWEASTSFLPARELGGDLYDFVQIDADRWGIMIGDVSGKGIPAALHMAVARTLFRLEARRNPDPVLTLARVNESLIDQVPQGCVTLLYAHLNIADGTLRLANAGHNYPIILNEAVREVPLDGLPLGIDRDYVFAETSICLRPGDVLIFYTDGVVEAVNSAGEVFGFERLYELLAASTLRRPRSLTRQIVRAVRAFTGPTPQNDDITLVVLRRRYQDRVQEMAEVALDVLGSEGSQFVRDHLQTLHVPDDAPPEVWRAAILTLGGLVRDRWGQGPSRELLQQLFLTLEGYL